MRYAKTLSADFATSTKGARARIPNFNGYEADSSRKGAIPIVNGKAGVRIHTDHGADPDRPCACSGLFGTVISERCVAGFRVIENEYASGLELPWHFHENAYMSYVLEGPYSESYGGSSAICPVGALRYLPPGQRHANVFAAGSRCLLVEVSQEALQRVEKQSKALERPGEIQGIASAWLAQRLYREFQQWDPFALIALEGILLELLAESARHPGIVQAVPRWLRSAREYVESNFLRPLSLAEVAGVAGVHRVHLSREFRRHFSTTVGEFLRSKRVKHACHLVSKTDEPLADIAMSCGFSDQSHFSAAFRRQIGLTPGRFRQIAQSRLSHRASQDVAV